MAKCSLCLVDLSAAAAESHYKGLIEEGRRHLDAAMSTGEYVEFNWATHCFSTACELRSDNEQARDGLSEAKLAFAEAACTRADFDLGLGIADANCPKHQVIIAKLSTGRDEQMARFKFRYRMRMAIPLILVVLLASSSGGLLYLNAERVRAIASERIANERASRAEEEARRLAAESAAQSRFFIEK